MLRGKTFILEIEKEIEKNKVKKNKNKMIK
jgi:hypothetical protein